MTTLALAPGTLIWTATAPRPIETLQVGDILWGFNPETFSRVPVTLRQVQVETSRMGRRLQVGGRMVIMGETDPCLRFHLSGESGSIPASTLHQGEFVAVDRQIPVPQHPIALPSLDAALTAHLDENALAMSDALYNSAAYFQEMAKRTRRLRLYEWLGYQCALRGLGDYPYGKEREHSLELYYDEGVLEAGDQSTLPDLSLWLGDKKRFREEQTLPEWLWRLGNPAISAFLRGFFDGIGKVTSETVTVTHPSLAVMAGIQSLLGRIHVEATMTFGGTFPTPPWYRLTIRNVRRFAEWVDSNLADHAGILKAVYTREPRYPSDTTAHLPLNLIRPSLERIRNRHTFPARTNDSADEGEVTKLETLRLLATAFHDSELRDAVNQQLYLEPVTENVTVTLDTLFILSVTSPATLIANGVVVGGS